MDLMELERAAGFRATRGTSAFLGVGGGDEGIRGLGKKTSDSGGIKPMRERNAAEHLPANVGRQCPGTLRCVGNHEGVGRAHVPIPSHVIHVRARGGGRMGGHRRGGGRRSRPRPRAGSVLPCQGWGTLDPKVGGTPSLPSPWGGAHKKKRITISIFAQKKLRFRPPPPKTLGATTLPRGGGDDDDPEGGSGARARGGSPRGG